MMYLVRLQPKMQIRSDPVIDMQYRILDIAVACLIVVFIIWQVAMMIREHEQRLDDKP
jgi:divalent metal cation (Fe/Co/Zn/Cd) transporter